MKDSTRTWINAIIGLAAVVLIVVLSPSPDYQARGILLPGKESRPAISPGSVIQSRSAPNSAINMGHINIERHYPAAGNLAQEEIGQLAQKLAAEVGANMIVVNNFRLGAVTRSKYIYVFQATAYYSPMAKSAWEPLLQ